PDDRSDAGHRRQRRGRARSPAAGRRSRYPDDLHRGRTRRGGTRAEASPGRPHLHASDRSPVERPQIHRPWTRRLRRPAVRNAMTKWRTSLTRIEPNKILMRGYPLDEVMGRLTFGEAIYLLLMGEVPSPAIGRLMEAILVSFIDHGVTPPSTLAAHNTATTGAPLRPRPPPRVLASPPPPPRHIH